MLETKGTKLYRGTGLTKKELQKYKELIGKTEIRLDPRDFIKKELPVLMALTGFISTSLDRALAETFVWFNEDTGHE